VTPDGIKIQQGKTGKKLMIARSDVLDAILERARRLGAHDSPYVLCNRSGTRYTSEGFRACWQRAMRKARRCGAVGERWTFHDLRAKCVSDSETLESTFERAGHTTMAMTRGVYDRNYRKVSPLK
jgi:integrase